MPNNFDVENSKPNNRDVENVKSNNFNVVNTRSNNSGVDTVQTIYTEDRTVQKGEIMLLVPLITFASAGTYSNAVRI